MSILNPTESKDRFILTGPFDDEMPFYYVLIKDYSFWSDNEPAIEEWMSKNLPRGVDHQTGMVLTIEEERDVMMFLLRWGP